MIWQEKIMKQLIVDVSTTPVVWNSYLTLANVTFDLDARHALLGEVSDS